MDDYHYKAILNNLFSNLYKNPLKDLTELSNPLYLSSILNEINPVSFAFIYDYIKINNNNNYDDLNEMINKMINELKIYINNDNDDFNKKFNININNIIDFEIDELIKLSQIIIVYSIIVGKKNNIYIEIIKNNFNKIIRKNIYKIIYYYFIHHIKKLIL